MHTISRRALLGGAFATVLLGGTGCAAVTASAKPSASGDYPVTIAHRYGETTINGRPRRVACLGYASHDACIAFGVLPVAMSGNLVSGEKTPWFTAELNQRVLPTPRKYAPEAGFPFREIQESNPDLILAVNSTLTLEEYSRLSAVAPVVAPPTTTAPDWRTTTRVVAQALGVDDHGDKVIATTERSIAKAIEPYAALTGLGGVYSDARAVAGADLRIYGSESNPSRILAEFGLAPSTALAAMVHPADTVLVPTDDLTVAANDILILGTPTKEVEELRVTTAGIRRNSLVLDRSAEAYALLEASPLSVRWAAEPILGELARVAFEIDGRRS